MRKALRKLTNIILCGISFYVYNPIEALAEKVRYETLNRQKEISTVVNVRLGMHTGAYVPVLDKELETVPYYFDNPSSGSINREGSHSEGGLKSGLECLVGTEELKFKVGADVRFNIGALIYQREEKNVSRETGSSAYINTSYFDEIPFIGVEYKVVDKGLLGLEFSLPYSGFHFSSGRKVDGHWEYFRKDTWNGFGISPIISISRILDDRNGNKTISLKIGYEHYNPKFSGRSVNVSRYIVSVEVGLPVVNRKFNW